MIKQTLYVAGFAFDESGDRVALIRKQRPEWQRGKLNGVGGHIEEGETAVKAMVREFWEETGVSTNEGHWTQFCVLSGDDWCVYFFTYRLPNLAGLKSMDEVIEIVNPRSFDGVINNLKWLIPLALSGEKIIGSYL